ncbi:heavy metal sensor histidine kinase [Sphingosinicella sp. LHD-64]|uniref:heavy metal sensor histidine kinase n=1 Tax=Sphingosinicella sp. LHD-64 TaxID=3072139 RepID=UPI00280EF0A0|nr:heavy metal sensor histidine kinase [Sphingosinicella sp. LHD-64]MDQ8755605.1 heavy metal sensor histidine kinase [Sphingosinicella sp. LHD-64]
MRATSVAGRVALMFGLAVTLVTALGGAAFYLVESRELRRHKQEEMAASFAIVEQLVRHSDTPAKWRQLVDKLDDLAEADVSLHFVIDSPDPAYRVDADFLSRDQWVGLQDGFDAIAVENRRYFTLARTIAREDERPEVRLAVASSTKYVDMSAAGLAFGIFVFSLLGVGSVSALGWLIARRSLAPVDRLSDHARLLGAKDLSRRLPTEKLPDELAGLVLSLNDALDRLEDSYQRMSTFSADAAHELRTPLANLIGETEVALSRHRAPAELEEVLYSNLEELERLRRIVADMLFLARADQGEMAAGFTDASLAEETCKSAEFMEMVFEEAEISVEVEGDARVPIERALFGRAITNLLDNAVRHGRTPGRVTVRIAEEKDRVTVSVSNPGAPLAPEHLERIFDRFYRVDPARPNSHDSHGFGLAIVRAVARIHGGSVFARNEPDGICVGFSIARRPTGSDAGLASPETRAPRLTPAPAA